MSFSDTQLRGSVTSILTGDPAIKMINFRFGKFTVGTMHFFTVAACINNDRIHCKVDPSKVPAYAAASYDITSNTIYAKDAQINYDDEKATVVHEATHAYIDMLGLVTKNLMVKALDNEICAYLAGAMYLTARAQQTATAGVKVTTSSQIKSIHDAAMNAVKGKPLGTGITNASNPINFSDKDVSKLRSEIKSNKLYSDWNTDQLMDGI